jgi:hypothetical protein
MSVLSRAPRQVYRVYDEAEFLATQLAESTDPSHSAGQRDPRRARLFAPILLVLTALVVGLLTIGQSGSSVRRSRNLDGHSRLPAGRRSAGVAVVTLPADRGGHEQAPARTTAAAKRPRMARRFTRAVLGRGRKPLPSAHPRTAVLSSDESVAVTNAVSDPPEFGFERGGSR